MSSLDSLDYSLSVVEWYRNILISVVCTSAIGHCQVYGTEGVPDYQHDNQILC